MFHSIQRLGLRGAQRSFLAFVLVLTAGGLSPAANAELSATIELTRAESPFYDFELSFSERVRYFSYQQLVTDADIVAFRQIDPQNFQVQLFVPNDQATGVFLHLPRQQVYSIFGEWNLQASLYYDIASGQSRATAEDLSEPATTALPAADTDIVAEAEVPADDPPAEVQATAEEPEAEAGEAEESATEVAEEVVAEVNASAEADSVVSALAPGESAPEVAQASSPPPGGVSAEMYLLNPQNSRDKAVVQIRFSSPVQGIEQRNFYSNTKITDFYGEYDDYFLEFEAFDVNDSRKTRIALITDYYFDSEQNRVIFRPLEIYAEFDANATTGTQAEVSYGALSDNFVESLRNNTTGGGAALPVVFYNPQQQALALGPEAIGTNNVSPALSESKLPGDLSDIRIKPPVEWQWGFVLNMGLASGGTDLVENDPGTDPTVDLSTTPNFPTFGVGIRWSTDQQLWQLQALLDYSGETFETSDSSSSFARTDLHFQYIYPVSAWTSMPFVQRLAVAGGLSYSSPSIDHSGEIVNSSLYTRATDLGSALGFNYSLRLAVGSRGKSVVEYRSVNNLEYNAAYMQANGVYLGGDDSVSGDYNGLFFNYVF